MCSYFHHHWSIKSIISSFLDYFGKEIRRKAQFGEFWMAEGQSGVDNGEGKGAGASRPGLSLATDPLWPLHRGLLARRALALPRGPKVSAGSHNTLTWDESTSGDSRRPGYIIRLLGNLQSQLWKPSPSGPFGPSDPYSTRLFTLHTSDFVALRTLLADPHHRSFKNSRFKCEGAHFFTGHHEMQINLRITCWLCVAKRTKI